MVMVVWGRGAALYVRRISRIGDEFRRWPVSTAVSNFLMGLILISFVENEYTISWVLYVWPCTVAWDLRGSILYQVTNLFMLLTAWICALLLVLSYILRTTSTWNPVRPGRYYQYHFDTAVGLKYYFVQSKRRFIRPPNLSINIEHYNISDSKRSWTPQNIPSHLHI